jgi:hypothetical protein
MPNRQPRALSRYRQVRITLTEEAGGRFSFRVMVKPVDAEWTFKHTVNVRSWRMSDPPATLAEVLTLLAAEVGAEAERLAGT